MEANGHGGSSGESDESAAGGDLDRSPVASLAPAPRDAHKGQRGKVLLVAGSRGMVGAAALAAEAALRGGAGLVSIACPRSVYPILAPMVPCTTTMPLPETDAGGLAFDALGALLARAEAWADAVAVGPGLGRDAATVRLVRALLERLPTPFVADADALFAIAGDISCLQRSRSRGILTPHAGEMGRLIQCSAREVQADRMGVARAFVCSSSHVLVLKGRGTLVADRARLWRCDLGNPGMATGGTGDVLAGLLGALLAQEGDAYRAARVGVQVHAHAGDLTAQRLGERTMLATDLFASLAAAFRALSAPVRSSSPV